MENTRRKVPVETTNSTTLVSCDGLGGYDWSDQAEEGPNYALMAYSTLSSDSELSTDSNCSKTCLKIVETLKSQNEQLLKDLRTYKIQTITYKTSLESVEIADKCKAGLGYNVVPPPYTEIFLPLKPYLSGLEEFVNEPIVSETTVKKPVVATSEVKASEDKPQFRFNTVRNKHVNTARPKAVVNTARPKAVLNVVKGNEVYDVKASACWVWKPKTKVIDRVSKHNSASITGNPQIVLQEKGVIDSGCSRHMTENMSYLTNYEEIDGRYVAFEGNHKGRKITGKEPNSSQDAGFKPFNDVGKKVNEVPRQENKCKDQKEKDSVNSTKRVNVVNVDSNEVNAVGRKSSIKLPDDPNMPELEDISIFEDSNEDVFGAEADLNNLESTFQVGPIPITRIHKDISLNKSLEICIQLLKQGECQRIWRNMVIQALKDPSWIEAMQEELLQFKLKEVWTLVDLPHGKRAIGSKWVFKNKLDEKGIMIMNKARLVAQGHTQEEGIDYDEVFAPVAKIEAIRLFLAYASFKEFMVYQMDVKSAFLYGKIKKEELCTFFEKLMHEKFQMSSMGELIFFLGLQVKQKQDGIFISQDKYVAKILKKFGFLKSRQQAHLWKLKSLYLKMKIKKK
uniref:Copia protein n=1 Tax=Tanacetum cinerariifolium TaxID=118510 RepID=A0A6L2L8L0_TANCI|nr:copia protein [Tanacetum cinerariifolium]